MRPNFISALAVFILPVFAHAQSLSPEDIARMLDEQAATPNPYAGLLNDPDPARSVGAMRIMMESGDRELIDIALEHGLLSANEAVRTAAFEAYLRTSPRLLVTFDGSDGLSPGMKDIGRRMGGTFTDDGMIHARWQLGQYDDAKECTLMADKDECAATVNANGIFLHGDFNYSFRGAVTVSEDGNLIGSVLVSNDRYPIRIQLLD